MSPATVARGAPAPRRLAAVLGAGLLGGLLTLAARAHETLAGYLQHHVSLALGARHVDVTVHLTFFEDGSEHERAHMDADEDGRIGRDEVESYLKTLAPRLAGAVQLRVAGRPVELLPLRAPELDLLGWPGTGRWHHRLSLFWFAATPTNLVAGSELAVEDRLWPGLPAVGLLQVEGRDGARLEALPLRDSLLPPARPEEAREFKARVLAPPKAAAATPETVQRKP